MSRLRVYSYEPRRPYGNYGSARMENGWDFRWEFSEREMEMITVALRYMIEFRLRGKEEIAEHEQLLAELTNPAPL